MKNKPDRTLSGGSYLFNEIKKRTQKPRKTIPLIVLDVNSDVANKELVALSVAR
jgi:hypothetical protein